MISLALLIVFQPITVIKAFQRDSGIVDSRIIPQAVKVNFMTPSFSYTRPMSAIAKYDRLDPKEVYRTYCWYFIAMQDSPGFISNYYGFPTKWISDILKNVPEEVFKEFVRHKFILYDRVEPLKSMPQGNDLPRYLNLNEEKAFVLDPKGTLRPKTKSSQVGPQAISKDSEEFKVLRFNVNTLTLKTNYPDDHFLVYTDAYHPFWRVKINNKSAPLYRAQYAFKGIWLPKGENRVVFNYAPLGGAWIYWGILIYFLLFLFVCLFFTKKGLKI